MNQHQNIVKKILTIKFFSKVLRSDKKINAHQIQQPIKYEATTPNFHELFDKQLQQVLIFSLVCFICYRFFFVTKQFDLLKEL